MFYTTLGFGSPTLLFLGPVAGVLLVLLAIVCITANAVRMKKGGSKRNGN